MDQLIELRRKLVMAPLKLIISAIITYFLVRGDGHNIVEILVIGIIMYGIASLLVNFLVFYRRVILMLVTVGIICIVYMFADSEIIRNIIAIGLLVTGPGIDLVRFIQFIFLKRKYKTE